MSSFPPVWRESGKADPDEFGKVARALELVSPPGTEEVSWEEGEDGSVVLGTTCLHGKEVKVRIEGGGDSDRLDFRWFSECQTCLGEIWAEVSTKTQ